MGRFGSQTSTYNRLVTIFVAIGSMVSTQTALRIGQLGDSNASTRPMATVLLLSPVLSASQDGILTSAFPPRVNLAMTVLQPPPSRPPMVSSALVVPLALSS